MYRAIPSRRQVERPLSGLLGVRGLGSIYSVYALPMYSCNSQASRERAVKMCGQARVNKDSFSPRYGSPNNRYPNTSSKPYQFQVNDLWAGPGARFDPCLVQSRQLCKAPPAVSTPAPPPEIKTPWNCPECFADPNPPATPVPPSRPPQQVVPEDPVVVIQETPVQESDFPVVMVETASEEEPEEDNTQYYVIGGIAALIVGGGLAYYLVTRKKKRR